MGIDFCNDTERIKVVNLFNTKRDMDIRPLYIYLCPVIIIVCFVSTIFNAVLMSISRQSRSVNKSPILLLSLNLAVTDLIASLLNGLGILLNSYLPEVHDIKMGQCSMLMFEVIRCAALVASALHLLALAFVHYRGIVNPLHYRSTIFFSQHLSRTINIISIGCWIIPLTIMIAWFSSVPCQGFQSNECDYLFLLAFTFRYMILTVFALPLLLMSIIYLRIFIIISRHQKGRRLNHERSALTRGVICATGPIVPPAASVNLSRLMSKSRSLSNKCPACAAAAASGRPGHSRSLDNDNNNNNDEDPTVSTLSEETTTSSGRVVANNDKLNDRSEMNSNDRATPRAATRAVIENEDQLDERQTNGQQMGAKAAGADHDLNRAASTVARSAAITCPGGSDGGGIVTNLRDSARTSINGWKTTLTAKPPADSSIYCQTLSHKETSLGSLSASSPQARELSTSADCDKLTGKTSNNQAKRAPFAKSVNIVDGLLLASETVGRNCFAPTAGDPSSGCRSIGQNNEATLAFNLDERQELRYEADESNGDEDASGSDLDDDQTTIVINPRAPMALSTTPLTETITKIAEQTTDELCDNVATGRPEVSRAKESLDTTSSADSAPLSSKSRGSPRAKPNSGPERDRPGERDETGAKPLGLVADKVGPGSIVVGQSHQFGGGQRKLWKSGRNYLSRLASCTKRSAEVNGQLEVDLSHRMDQVKRIESNSGQLLEAPKGGEDFSSAWECTCDNKLARSGVKLSRANTIGSKVKREQQEQEQRATSFGAKSRWTKPPKPLVLMQNSQRSSISSRWPAQAQTSELLPQAPLQPAQAPSGPRKHHSLKLQLRRSNTTSSGSQFNVPTTNKQRFRPGTSGSFAGLSPVAVNSSSSSPAPATSNYIGLSDYPSVATTTNVTISHSTYEPQRRHIHASAVPQTNTKALVTTLLILGTYFISYVPAIIYQVLTCIDNCPYPLYDLSFSRRILFGAMTTLLLIAKSIIDPFIYSYRMSEIQVAITRYLSKRRSKSSTSMMGATSMQTSQRLTTTNNNYYNMAGIPAQSQLQYNQHKHHHQFDSMPTTNNNSIANSSLKILNSDNAGDASKSAARCAQVASVRYELAGKTSTDALETPEEDPDEQQAPPNEAVRLPELIEQPEVQVKMLLDKRTKTGAHKSPLEADKSNSCDFKTITNKQVFNEADNVSASCLLDRSEDAGDVNGDEAAMKLLAVKEDTDSENKSNDETTKITSKRTIDVCLSKTKMSAARLAEQKTTSQDNTTTTNRSINGQIKFNLSEHKVAIPTSTTIKTTTTMSTVSTTVNAMESSGTSSSSSSGSNSTKSLIKCDNGFENNNNKAKSYNRLNSDELAGLLQL